jgi:hypothetical protein
MRPCRTIALFAAVTGIACSEPQAPASSSCTNIHGKPPVDTLGCTPVRSNVSCVFFMTEVCGPATDVTAIATWSVLESSSIPSPPSPVAVVTSPGVIVPVSRGNLAIRAIANGIWGAPLHTFAVDPNGPAVALCPQIAGGVDDERGVSIPGALVEIIDGPDVGKIGTVSSLTHTYIIDHVRMGVAFTMRASKPGYVAQTQVHPAITDDPTPEPVFLDFKLSRAN